MDENRASIPGERALREMATNLLALDNRNPMINFRPESSFATELVAPEAEALFQEALRRGEEGIIPLAIPQTPPGEETPALPKQTAREAWIAHHAPSLRSGWALPWRAGKQGTTLATHLRNVAKRNRSEVEEKGVNVLQLAFGFVRWTEAQAREGVMHLAPLLLIPVTLRQTRHTFELSVLDDEPVVNPTFDQKLLRDEGQRLPQYEQGQSLEAYLATVRQVVTPLGWDVEQACFLCILSFYKISIYRDLIDNQERVLRHRIVRHLLDVAGEVYSDASRDCPPLQVPLMELHTVVSADSSQLEAVELAKAGGSFVLQGPPGTGKSQTITNIIAECLHDGKRVLFVSEKQAALNIVLQNLAEVGLRDFCLALHSHKEQGRRKIIQELCDTLDLAIPSAPTGAKRLLADKAAALETLEGRAKALLGAREDFDGQSLHDLITRQYAPLCEAPTLPFLFPELEGQTEAQTDAQRALLKQGPEYADFLAHPTEENVWFGYAGERDDLMTRERLRGLLTDARSILERLAAIARETEARYGIACDRAEEIAVWRDLFAALAQAPAFSPTLLEGTRIDAVLSAAKVLAKRSRTLQGQRERLLGIFREEAFAIPAEPMFRTLMQDCGDALTRGFSLLFGGVYKTQMALLRTRLRPERKPSYTDAVAWLGMMDNYQHGLQTFEAATKDLRGWLGETFRGIDTDWGLVTSALESLRRAKLAVPALGRLAQAESWEVEREAFADLAKRLTNCLGAAPTAVADLAAYFDRDATDFLGMPCRAAIARCDACLAHLEDLPRWRRFLRFLEALKEHGCRAFFDKAREAGIPLEQIPDALGRQFYLQLIDRLIGETPSLDASAETREADRVRFQTCDEKHQALNRKAIAAELAKVRQTLPTDPVLGRGVSALRRQRARSRGQLSIRRLLASEVGPVAQALKPCFLMSPLSVSTFLDAAGDNAPHFDVVIFDEASQVLPEDAIGAIYRADQLIVVGDDKQMPPTDFFRASAAPEDAVLYKSILDLCATFLPTKMLLWHYRSRSEDLIAFSNRAFYGSRLITVPSARLPGPDFGVEYVWGDGSYLQGVATNQREAEAIAQLVVKHFRTYGGERSLGVIVTNQAQQELVERLVHQACDKDKTLHDLAQEEIDPEKRPEPFFVKNIETVQGDERDTILFGLTFAKGPDGRLSHNFGPLNQEGGERRLNVAVTRARINCKLVTSLHYGDIDLSRVSAKGPGGGVARLRQYLEFAETGALHDPAVASPEPRFDSPFEEQVYRFLQANGFTVSSQMGCSGYRIDLAILLPETTYHALAIECDGAPYHSSREARDRDILRQQCLERQGWRFHRIWSTDWFRERGRTESRLLEAAHKAVAAKEAEVAALKANEHPVPPTPPEPEGDSPAPEPPENSTPPSEPPTPEPPVEPSPGLYVAADLARLAKEHGTDFPAFIEAALRVEAPVEVDALIRRILAETALLPGHGRKLTDAVRRDFARKLRGAADRGIVRKDGFFYLEAMGAIPFRRHNPDCPREVSEIALEELAAGMRDLLRERGPLGRMELYRALREQCGKSATSRQMTDRFDKAFALLAPQEGRWGLFHL